MSAILTYRAGNRAHRYPGNGADRHCFSEAVTGPAVEGEHW